MTQKELLYFEDAIGHEGNIISILKKSINALENEELINFLENELSIHEKRKQSLLDCLEASANEWSVING